MPSVWDAFESPQNDQKKAQKEEKISVARAPVELETAVPTLENDLSLNVQTRLKREASENNSVEEAEDAGLGMSV